MAKEKSTKTIEMKSKKDGNVENQDPSKKLSYEQLEQVAGNLNQQCKQMQQIINSQQQTIVEFNEISMLLDILGKGEYFHEDFVTRCSNKVEELITRAMDAAEKQKEEKGPK